MRFYELGLKAAAMSAVIVGFGAQAALAEIVYDSIPDPLPPSITSLGYQATGTFEFGQEVTFTGSGTLSNVTVTMASWACENGAWQNSDCVSTPGSSFTHPITLNLYNPNDLTTPIATVTQSIEIPFRPSFDSENCSGGTWYDPATTTCYNGFAFNAEFDFSSEGFSLPATVVFGVAFNTNTYGDSPIGASGPYESLNVGVVIGGVPSVGTAGGNAWDNGAGLVGGLAWGYLIPARFETAASLACAGFEPPADGTIVVKKPNRVLPLRMILNDQDGMVVWDIPAPVVNVDYAPPGSSSSSPYTDELTYVGRGDEGNQFFFDGSKWSFNLSTKGLASGTYQITTIAGSTDYIIEPTCSVELIIE